MYSRQHVNAYLSTFLPVTNISLDSSQDANEDTEWNDILRSKGILPPKPKETEVTEDQIVSMLEETIEQKQGNS